MFFVLLFHNIQQHYVTFFVFVVNELCSDNSIKILG